MNKLFAVLVFVLVCTIQAPAQSLTDIKVERVTDSTGACAGIMAHAFPVACTSLLVKATSNDPAVIGFLFLMIYTDPTGTPHVVQQSSFTSESGQYSTSFPDFSANYHIGALPLTGGTPVWVTP
jgi:hypothetical protein